MSQETPLYAITAATGHTGRRIAQDLLAARKKARVIGRSAERLQPLVEKGAEPCVGSVDDIAAMTRAFTGATAVYTLIPPDLAQKDFRGYQNQVSEALVAALRQAGVRYVVNMSSVGAHVGEKLGPINGLHDHEQRMNTLDGVNIVHLRPGFFIENLFMLIEPIKKMGAAGSPLRGDVPLAMIATQDIAAVATKLLLDLSFSGKSTRELLGERDLTMQEATQVLGKAIGKENLPYKQVPFEVAEQAMVAMGMSPESARLLNQMYRSANEGLLRPAEPRSPENTTPTSIEDFAPVFAQVFRG